jgi:formate dehydrogenase alpha subunit
VEVQGERGLQTSCSLKARQGMEVKTETKDIVRHRKATLEMLVSEHRMVCATCDRDGDCLLQDYSYRYGINERRYPAIPMAVDHQNYTSRDKALAYDPTKCVRCSRCVRICEEVQGANALTLRSRGGTTLVSTPFDVLLKDSSCESCGQCIGVCPTAALSSRAAAGAGKSKDLQETRTTCVYCGTGCQINLHVDVRKNVLVRASGADMIPNEGSLCVKGQFGLDFLNRPDRLTHPLIRENGVLRRADWEEALTLVSRRLSAIRAETGPDSLAVLSSAKTTNEDNYLMQKLARAVLGTNNIDHCARLCHASTVAGLARAFGSGAMTNSIAEVPEAEVVFIIGSNTTECHPVIGSLIRQAARSGKTRLIVADPRRISLTADAGIYMQHRPGTDVALINAMMQVVLSEGLEDLEFIKNRTEDFDSVRESVMSFTPEIAAGITGVPAQDIRRAARLYAGAETAAIVYSMGITQHSTGTDNVLSVANLAMLTGQVGRKNAGVYPLRGQNNVQGACDMGSLPDVYPGYQKVADAAMREKFSRAWGRELPEAPGLTVVEMMKAAASGQIRGMYIMGENPMLSDPDITSVAAGLENLDFLVVQDIFLSETAQIADVVLPAAAFAERDGTYTNTERRVQMVRQALVAPGEARPDWQIIAEISSRLGYPMSYPDSSAIQDEVASLVPIYGGITHNRLSDVGLQWPCPDPGHPGTEFLHSRTFTRGLGKFHGVSYLPPRELPDKDYPFILTTGRMLEHWHTGTMTRRSVVLDHLEPAGFIELNPEDAENLQVTEGGLLNVSSRRGRISVPARITEKVFPGCVFLTFHFRENPANVLTIAALDPIARIPEFKACAVRVEKS